ncbi:MAG: hypothetical protein HYS20_06965 [Rhodocyclales bacterium]|nr:hypothetical protein [Rhodocyclales bacterium]
MSGDTFRHIGSAAHRLRLLLLIGAGSACAVLALLLYTAHLHTALAADLTHAHARELAANIASLSQSEVASNDRVALFNRLESFNAINHIRSIAITNRLVEPLAAVRRNAADNLSAVTSRDITFAWRPGTAVPQPRGVMNIPESVAIWSAIGQIAPIGWVYLEYETDTLASARNRFLASASVMALGLWGATLLILVLVSRRAWTEGVEEHQI